MTNSWMIVVTAMAINVVNGRLLGIPTVPFRTSIDRQFSLETIDFITVDSQYANSTDTKGQTLIPPTLHAFATTFASDLGLLLNKTIGVLTAENASSDSVFLTVGDASQYLDVAGRPTSEGYSLSVSASSVVITGASPLGAWWGTRTLLQQAALNGSVPFGLANDSPGWATRGMMLDAGRHYYPPDFLIEMCSYMSYFKQNTFHVHLSDNLYNNVDIYSRERSLDLYARFRLWSEEPGVSGLNKHKNESYTRDQFDGIQTACAARGVTVLPEIEAPGHALVIVQWKPELGLSTDLSLLNISHPETIPTMKTIWSTFLPWFHTKVVSIGADEYTDSVDAYNSFVNTMATYIDSVSGKSTRIWGTFPPKNNYTNIYKNVSIQHWEYFEDDPYYDYILNDYSVLNSDDTFYVVNKWSGSYPQSTPISQSFTGDPDGNTLWYPNVFNTKNVTENPPKANSLVLGAIAPLWNDYGPNASVYSEAYYAWREGVPALADKQWGGNLTSAEFPPTFSTLHPHIPGQNLDRMIVSKSVDIVSYTFTPNTTLLGSDSIAVFDLTQNGYDAETDCPITSNRTLFISSNCTFTTPLGSKGRNYTLTVSLNISRLFSPTNTTLLSGPDSSLLLTPNITLFQGGNYYRLNETLPLNEEVEFSIIARGNRTFAQRSGSREREFLTMMGINGASFVWKEMAIEAPLKSMGGENAGWEGELKKIRLSSVA